MKILILKTKLFKIFLIHINSNFLFFQSLLRTADQLKIKGLCEVSDDRKPVSIDKHSEAPVSPKAIHRFRRGPLKRPRSLESSRKAPKLENAGDEEDVGPDGATEDKMTGHSLLPAQALFPQLCGDNEEFPPEPPGPAATPVSTIFEQTKHFI